MRRAAACTLIVATALVAGCGGDKDKEAVTEPCPAAPSALAKTPALPEGFAKPQEVVYTGVRKLGPTTVVSGYLPGEVDQAFDAYKDGFKSPYTVTHDEHEADDAEVNFAGANTSGQVKLVQACKDRTTVTLTIRPA